MLKTKTKDELMIALEKELSMREHLMRNYEENKPLADVCAGRIQSLKFALGFDELNKEEE